MDGPESGHQATATRPTLPDDYAVAPLSEVDPEIGEVLERELERQRNALEMIASENFVPRAILEVVGSRDGVKRLERVFRFGDFAGALAFTDGVGERAEQAGHHPALLTE